MKLLISACLLGMPCRYDGAAKPCREAIRLKQVFDVVPICPEQMGGLPTPRVPAERCSELVITKDGRDVTKAFAEGAKKALELAKAHGCKAAVLKERSPSCGCGKIYDGTFTGTLTDGDGITAKLLKEAGIEVIGESQIAQRFFR